MPYASYARLTNDDIEALYAHFMQEVQPVDEPAAKQTSLPFPYNMRFSARTVAPSWFFSTSSAAPMLCLSPGRGRLADDAPERAGEMRLIAHAAAQGNLTE
jgi:hypothetical protein